MQTLYAIAFTASLAAAQGRGQGRQDFLQWSAEQGKNYSSYTEMQMREAIFNNNS